MSHAQSHESDQIENKMSIEFVIFNNYRFSIALMQHSRAYEMESRSFVEKTRLWTVA